MLGYTNQAQLLINCGIIDVLARTPASDTVAYLPLAATIYQNRDFGMVDVIPPGCSKGSTLAEWVRRRGWSREDVMAIGDNHNDLEMLHYAGLPVVMGNSVPELKSLGWRETLSNGEGGVAAAIEAYALGAM